MALYVERQRCSNRAGQTFRDVLHAHGEELCATHLTGVCMDVLHAYGETANGPSLFAGVGQSAPCAWKNGNRDGKTRSRHASLHTYGRTAAIATCSPHMDFLIQAVLDLHEAACVPAPHLDFLHAHGATRRSDWLKILLLRLLMGYSRALRIKTEAVA